MQAIGIDINDNYLKFAKKRVEKINFSNSNENKLNINSIINNNLI